MSRTLEWKPCGQINKFDSVRGQNLISDTSDWGRKSQYKRSLKTLMLWLPTDKIRKLRSPSKTIDSPFIFIIKKLLFLTNGSINRNSCAFNLLLWLLFVLLFAHDIVNIISVTWMLPSFGCHTIFQTFHHHSRHRHQVKNLFLPELGVA